MHESYNFLQKRSELVAFAQGMDGNGKRKKYIHHNFYKHFRRINQHLIDEKGNFEGGQVSYDEHNMQPFPKEQNDKKFDKLFDLEHYELIDEAKNYVEKYFPNNFGQDICYCPVTFTDSKKWLKWFINQRLN